MSHKKKILYIFGGECFKLPPFLTILDSLCRDSSITVLCNEFDENLKKLNLIYKDGDVTFENVTNRAKPSKSLYHRIKNYIKRNLKFETSFHQGVRRILPQKDFDKLWIIHENTLAEIQDLLLDKKYVVSMYELNDARKGFLKSIEFGLKAAEKIIVCEPNRAQILRVWLNLNSTPSVIPNKPLKHPRKRRLTIECPLGDDNKKVILYQGHIQLNRNVEAFCKAVEDMKDFQLVLMGPQTEYRDELEKKYPNLKIVDFVNPPYHLNITSHAYIGIVKYDYVDLNSIYCAPNKTFEYAGFGIPMIANEIPGLTQSVGVWGAAECINTDDVEAIKAAIQKIDTNYEQYSIGATKFYESVDIKQLIENIINGK